VQCNVICIHNTGGNDTKKKHLRQRQKDSTSGNETNKESTGGNESDKESTCMGPRNLNRNYGPRARIAIQMSAINI